MVSYTVINHRERCPSGRRRRTRNPLYRLTVPRVRIPLSPKARNFFRAVYRFQEGCPSGRRCTLGRRVCSKGTGGSNPPPSVSFPQSDRFCAIDGHPTPSGPEGSSGKWFIDEPQVIYLLGFFIPVYISRHSHNIRQNISSKSPSDSRTR